MLKNMVTKIIIFVILKTVIMELEKAITSFVMIVIKESMDIDKQMEDDS